METTVGVGDPVARRGSGSLTDDNGRYWIYGVPTGEIHMDNNGFGTITFTGAPEEIVAVDWRVAPDGGHPDDPGSMP
jgi:hypothetical protein